MSGWPDTLDLLATELAKPGGGVQVVRGRPHRNGRKAAVLVLFCEVAGALGVVLIEKSAQLRNHAGQCAFPGGGVEPGDASSMDAAFREAREEVGLRQESVDLVGVLPPAHVAVTGYDVTPVVGWWRQPHQLEIVDAVEVNAIHIVKVADLADPEHRVTWRLPMGRRGPAFVVDDLFIWGFTSHVLDGLITLAGWEQPWDSRRTELVPERFWRRECGERQ